MLIGEKKGGNEGTAQRGNQAVAQLMKANGITESEALRIIDEAIGTWMNRSKHKTWAVNIAPELIDNQPVFADLTL